VADVEFTRTQTLSREEAVKLLTTLAEALASGDGHAHLQLGDSRVSLHVAEEVRAEVEVEIDGDEVELEVELKWSLDGGRRGRRAHTSS
jgi:amphi-Trp domain-containing protein